MPMNPTRFFYTITTLLFILPLYCHAQKEAAIWYFGNNAGLDFNYAPPQPIQNPNLQTAEGCSSISDHNGRLLFYTDGQTVWNKKHTMMENGNGLFGHGSSTHSSLVVKKPNSNHEYYIITSAYCDDPSIPNKGVNYSLVDMDFNEGNGKVVTKNSPLIGASGEKIAVTPHRDKKNMWVAIPEGNSGTLHIFLLTENGFELKSTNRNQFPKTRTSHGQIKFSLDGQYLGMVFTENNVTVILAFDNTSGIVTLYQTIKGCYPYGIEFSPSGNYIYVSTRFQSGLSQCELATGITNCYLDCNAYESWQSTFPIRGPNGQLQLGPDQKIYFAQDNSGFIGVINFPDSAFSKSGYNDSIPLLPGTLCRQGLPTFNAGYIVPKINIADMCLGDTTHFSINKTTLLYDSVHWLIDNNSTADTNSLISHIFDKPGLHTIEAILYDGNNTDSVSRSFSIQLLPINPQIADSAVCFDQHVVFNAYRELNVHYEWSTGSTDSAITADQAGSYTLRLTKNGCVVTDSITLTHSPYPIVHLEDDAVICAGTQYTASAYLDNASYLWSTTDTTPSIELTSEQEYWVRVTKDGCSSSDTAVLNTTIMPAPNLGSDTAICASQSLTYLVHAPYGTYFWNTGDTIPSLIVTAPGIYSVAITNPCGTVYDTVIISEQSCDCRVWVPNAFTPNKDLTNDGFRPLTLCEYDYYVLTVYNRWGQELFRSNTPSIAWDGNHKGVEQPSDVYVWKLTCTLRHSMAKPIAKNLSGTVTLLR
jgi:gliding motility-associated-like protein